MISSQMPGNATETSQPYHSTLYSPNSNIQEPLLEQDSSLLQSTLQNSTPMSGFEKLLSIVGVYIEKSSFTGKAQCCGPPARIDVVAYSYKISDLKAYGAEKKGRGGPAILQGKDSVEDSSNIWCAASCCAFDIEINHGGDKDSNSNSFLKFERDFKCSFMCMARPEMIVSLVEEGKNERLGRIVNPIQCCMDFRMKIYDARDVLKYVIKSDCCDCSVNNPGSCPQLETIMTVSDPFGNVESKLVIQGVGCSFLMAFPKNSSGPDRALLMAAVMMIGKTFFDGAGPLTICGAICEAFSGLRR